MFFIWLRRNWASRRIFEQKN